MSSDDINGLRALLHRNKVLNTLRLLGHKLKNVFYTLLSGLGYKYNLEVYDDDFYAQNQRAGLEFNKWFVPLLCEVFEFKSLIDVGCGTGHCLLAFQQSGISDVYGMEGSPFAFKHLLVAERLVARHDLRQPYTFNRRWDIAISIEVAEHIDDVDTANYVKILCNAADTVVITAAPLGQGGTLHINEHSREWWAKKFLVESFHFDPESTRKMVAGMEKAKAGNIPIASCYATNIMAFKRAK